jgi:uncharacterized protein (DUF1810 family)
VSALGEEEYGINTSSLAKHQAYVSKEILGEKLDSCYRGKQNRLWIAKSKNVHSRYLRLVAHWILVPL